MQRKIPVIEIINDPVLLEKNRNMVLSHLITVADWGHVGSNYSLKELVMLADAMTGKCYLGKSYKRKFTRYDAAIAVQQLEAGMQIGQRPERAKENAERVEREFNRKYGHMIPDIEAPPKPMEDLEDVKKMFGAIRDHLK